MKRKPSIKALREALPEIQKELQAAKNRAEKAQNKLNLLVQEEDYILKLLEIHGYGETESATPGTGELELKEPRPRLLTPGFRDAVRSILLGAPEPLRPPEVARKLEAINFQYNGSTTLAQRVGSELSRMYSAGLVEKIDLAYRLPSKTGEGMS